MSSYPRLCVIVPAFNERDVIGPCLQALQAALPRADILVVDNASTDGTGLAAREEGVEVLHEPRPGKGHAVTAGVHWAVARDYAWIALHDADNEYEPEDLARLWATCLREPRGALMGVGDRLVSLSRVLWRSLLANWVARCALQLALRRPAPSDILTGARLFSASAARLLFGLQGQLAHGDLRGFELETALTRRAMRAQLPIVSVPVRYTPRAVAEKKIGALDLLPILKAAWSA